MSYYIHFWTKDKKLERVPYPTLEEAEKYVWEWERAERARFEFSGLLDPGSVSFPGHIRNKMAVLISDEDNQICKVDQWGQSFIWDVKHSPHLMNDNWWAVRFEAASRGLTRENVVCDCWMCTETPREEVKQIGVTAIFEQPTRDQRIVDEFRKGLSRKAIAEKLDVSYSTVCKVIREGK